LSVLVVVAALGRSWRGVVTGRTLARWPRPLADRAGRRGFPRAGRGPGL